jgi:hypothetical protein
MGAIVRAAPHPLLAVAEVSWRARRSQSLVTPESLQPMRKIVRPKALSHGCRQVVRIEVFKNHERTVWPMRTPDDH